MNNIYTSHSKPLKITQKKDSLKDKNTNFIYLHVPFFCSSLFLAASSLCFLITASRARSALA